MSSDLFFTRDSRLTFLYRRELILLSRLVSLPRRLPSPLPLLRSVEIHSVSFDILETPRSALTRCLTPGGALTALYKTSTTAASLTAVSRSLSRIELADC